MDRQTMISATHSTRRNRLADEYTHTRGGGITTPMAVEYFDDFDGDILFCLLHVNTKATQLIFVPVIPTN